MDLMYAVATAVFLSVWHDAMSLTDDVWNVWNDVCMFVPLSASWVLGDRGGNIPCNTSKLLTSENSRCCERPAGSSWVVVVKLFIFLSCFFLKFCCSRKMCSRSRWPLTAGKGQRPALPTHHHHQHAPSGFSHAAASPPALITAAATLSFPLWPAGFSQKISWRVITGAQVNADDLRLRQVTPADVRGSLAQQEGVNSFIHSFSIPEYWY